MEEKEVLQAILFEIKNLKNDVASVKEDVASVKEDVVSVKEDVASVKEDVASIKEDVANVKEDVASVKEDVASVKEDVANVKEDLANFKAETNQRFDAISQVQQHVQVILESETNKNITLICEAVETIVEKQKKLIEVDDLKDRMGNAERVLKYHTEQIDKLKKAK